MVNSIEEMLNESQKVGYILKVASNKGYDMTYDQVIAVMEAIKDYERLMNPNADIDKLKALASAHPHIFYKVGFI